MLLELLWSEVRAVRDGRATGFVGHDLTLSLPDLRSLVAADARLERARIDLAHPGESCRIARVLDVIAPRARLDGAEDFPGVVGALARAGSGRTRGLEGVAVVVTDQQIQNTSTLALIDMSGPAAALTEFARTHNVVVSAWP